jgi:hypothetical protein
VSRPTEEAARAAVDAFLLAQLGEVPWYSLNEDGDEHWSFWVRSEDTTSYVHADLSIEWYGTAWPDKDEGGVVDE